MAKYIRTKHGTIEINDSAIEREIVAKADTIVELCDYFERVGVDREEDGTLAELAPLYKYLWEAQTGEYCEIYGVIETDKGYIRVAKMNEKREFELL